MDGSTAGFEVVEVREHPMPAPARLFEVPLHDGTLLRISTGLRGESRTLGLVRADADEAAVTVRLTPAEASTVGSLLSGTRVIVHGIDDAPAEGVATRTIVVGADSPAIDSPLAELALPDPDEARVIAVIRDDTPQLVEEDPDHRFRPGDRLVVVGRAAALERLVTELLG